MKRQSPPTPADRVGLGMEVRSVAEHFHLVLPPRTLFGWLQLARLELRVPGSATPVPPPSSEPSEAMPSALSFQRVRSEVVSAELRMSQADLDRYVSGCGDALAGLGVDELVLRCSDSYIGVSARVRESALVADLSARIYLNCGDQKLRISIGHARVYGHLDTPAPVLAHRLVAALLQTSNDSTISILGLGDFQLFPLRSALYHSLPMAGWRLPRQGTAPLRGAQVDAAQISLRFSESLHSGSSTSQASIALTTSLDTFRAADTLLLAGDLEGAMRGYRGELAARGPEQPFLVERILCIASARREYFMDGVELARQVLGRWPDFAPAHAAIASIAVAQGEIESGAARYRELSLASGATGDEEGTVRAALAGARLLRQFAPDESTRLYEVVLDHRPGHSETSEALADRYRDEKRWGDLVRLIRTRLAATSDPRRQARDHARLAEVLVEQQHDPEAALAELECACRTDESVASIHEQRAEVEFLLGHEEDALASLEFACSLHRLRDDKRGQVRVLLRGGEGTLAVRSFETAEAWFLAALDVDHGSSEAMNGAARAASGQEHHEEASRLWRELLDAGVESPALQAHFACELGRSMLAAGMTDEAAAPLERAAATVCGRTSAEALALLATIRAQSGAQTEAMQLWRRSIDQFLSADDEPDTALQTRESEARYLSPLLAETRAAQVSLQRATFGIEHGLVDGASEDLLRAFSLSNPGDSTRAGSASLLLKIIPDSKDEIAWIDELARAAESPDERAPLEIHRARHLTKTGNHKEAIAALLATLESPDVSDSLKSLALQLKADILRDMGEVGAHADVLQERASLSGSLRERAETSLASAIGWLSANDWPRSQAAIRTVLHLVESDDSLFDLRQEALLCLGNGSWKARQWGEVVEAYSQLSGGEPAREDGSDTLEQDCQQLLRWGIALEHLGRAQLSVNVLKQVRNAKNCTATESAQACQHLADLYERLQDLTQAANCQELYADSNLGDLSSAARADAWYQAGALHRRNENSIDDAKRCLDTALRIASDHLPALDALEQISREEQDHERLAVILGRKIAVMSAHPARLRGLLVRLARLQEQELGRFDVARETYRRVLTLAPRYRPALLFAAREAQASANHPFAAETLELLAGPLENDSELHLSTEELAAQQESSLFDLASVVIGTAGQVASSSISSILLSEARKRDSFRLWTALAAAYRRQANLAGLADALGHLAEHAEPEQSLELSLERIALLANELGDRGSALLALRSAQEHASQSPLLRDWQERLENEASIPASQTLDPTISPEATRGFSNKKHRPPGGVADSASPSNQRLNESSHSAQGCDPTSEPSTERLWSQVTTALANENPKRAVELLGNLAERAHAASDVVAEHRATRKLADVILETKGAEEVALRLYQRAYALDPRDFIAAQLCSSLAPVAEPKLSTSPADESPERAPGNHSAGSATANGRPVSDELSERAREALSTGKLDKALLLLEEAIALEPAQTALYREFADIALAARQPARAAEQLEALADLLSSGATPSESLSDLHLHIAAIYYDDLASVDNARTHMRRAAKASRSETQRDATLRQLAVESSSAGSYHDAINAYESIGLHKLASHERFTLAKQYQVLGRDHAAIKLLEAARLAGSLTSDSRALLFSLCRDRSRLQDFAAALEGGAPGAPRQVTQVRLSEALRIYTKMLYDDDGAARVARALQGMGLAIPSLKAANLPAPTLRDATFPTNLRSSVFEPTEGRLAGLQYAAEHAASIGDSEVAASLIGIGLTEYCHGLCSSDSSKSSGQYTPDSMATHLLAKLRNLVLQGNWHDSGSAIANHRPSASQVATLIHGLIAVVSSIENSAAAVPLLQEIATLRRTELHDAQGAGDALMRALPLAPGDTEIFSCAVEALEETRDYDRLASAYEMHIDSLEGSERVQPLIALGTLCHDVLRDTKRARRCCDEAAKLGESSSEDLIALQRAVGSAPVLGDLAYQELTATLQRAHSLDSQGDRAQALALYEDASLSAPQDARAFYALRNIFQDTQDEEKLARVLEQLTTLSTSRTERAGLFYERAMLARDVYHDDTLVYEYLKEAVANAPDESQYANELRTISMARGDWKRVAELTYQEICRTGSAEEQAALYLELAMIFDEKLLSPAQALLNYEKALSLDGSILAVPKPLARLYEQESRYAEAAAMYQQAAQATADASESIRCLHAAAVNAESAGLDEVATKLYEQLSTLSNGEEEQSAPQPSSLPEFDLHVRRAHSAEALNDYDQAHKSWKLANLLAPNDPVALAGVCRSASHLGDYGQALAAQQVLVHVIAARDVEKLRDARIILSDLCLTLGDLSGAIHSYETLLQEIPECDAAVRALPDLYLQARRPSEAITALKSLILQTPDHAQRAPLLFTLGEVYSEVDDSLDLAHETYFRAIDLDPEHVPTLRRLLAYYNQEGDFQATSEIATDLQRQDRLLGTQTSIRTLYRTGLAAAFADDLRLVRTIGEWLGSGQPAELARAIREVYELGNPPQPSALAEAARVLCKAAGENLNAVAKALGQQESAKNLGHLIKSLSELA